MIKFNKLSCVQIFVIVAAILFSGSISAQQKSCLFASELDPHPNDVPIISWLESKYTVEVITEADLRGKPVEEFKAFDFVFLSKTIGSSDPINLKGAPVPLFFTELFSNKLEITGWVPISVESTDYGYSKETDLLIVDGEHFLAAGLETDAVIELATGTNVAEGNIYSWAVPQVDHIPIAVLESDPTKLVVFGIDKGTVLYNAPNVKDGSLVSECRCVAYGVHHSAAEFITDDGWNLMDAAIRWILEEEPTGVEKAFVNPDEYSLSQIYPNPFNSSTTIKYNLTQSGKVTLKIYNLSGQELVTLINEFQVAGEKEVTWQPKGLPGGIYFYRLQTSEYSETKRLILQK
jgi:hypothetical protein